MKHKITKIDDGRYEYRGYRIHRNDDTPKGYWGRWSVGNRGYTSASRKDCMEWIDHNLDRRIKSNLLIDISK